MNTPTRDQILRYVQSRFSGQRITAHRELSLRCPFHADSTASLSFNTEKGVWKCHTGCGSGGLIEFEQKLNGGSHEEARARLEEVMSAENLFASSHRKIVAVYPYVDEQGRLLFEKLRYEPKNFSQRRRLANGSYAYDLDGVREKPLYRLPEVLIANCVFICEGEKDADRVASLNLGNEHIRVAATTNFDGAKKTGRSWNEKDSVLLAKKRVIIFVDNDDGGRAHAQRVAESVSKFACGVRVLELPGLPEKGDVSDWLDARHTREELIEQIKKAPSWKPHETAHVILAEASVFVADPRPEIEYLVERVIQKGGNGCIVGTQKAGKSLLAIHLLLALTTGTSWLGFRVAERVKCGLISREDNFELTKQRLVELYRGGDWRTSFKDWLWINTRKQTPTFLLSSDDDVSQLIEELRMEQIEFAVFDVLRRLHDEDENDNTKMQKMLNQLSRIQTEAGCAVAVVHHVSKHYDGSVFRNIRGAGAIDGWTEWAMGVTITNPEEKIPRKINRELQFETKAAEAANPVSFRIESISDTMRIVLTDAPQDNSNYSMAALLGERE